MSTEAVIMVQIADREWTLDALHCACKMARERPAKIALLQMIPVRHPAHLGTDFGYLNYSRDDEDNLKDYEETVKDYGVECSTHLYQYASLAGALAEAADYVDAHIVIACLPRSIIPFWQSLQRVVLRFHLAQNRRQLIERPASCLSWPPVSLALHRTQSV